MLIHLPPVTKKYEIVTIVYMNIADGCFNHDGRFKRKLGTSRMLKGKLYKDSIFEELVFLRELECKINYLLFIYYNSGQIFTQINIKDQTVNLEFHLRLRNSRLF